MTDNPSISVIMCMHNGEKYLKEAIESILNQSYDTFEFIIINDASTDNSLQIAAGYRDPRIRIISNPEKRGIAASVNRGLALAQGKYIARMDADDISEKNRFFEQVAFLESNPSVGLCGSWMTAFNENDTRLVTYPTMPDMIKTGLFIYCPVGQPTVMGRREVFDTFRYNEDFFIAEDYDLWQRISEKYAIANIGSPLHRYRIHDKSATWQFRNTLTELSDLVRLRQLQMIGIQPSEYEKFLHLSLLCNLKEGFWKYSLDLFKWVRKCIRANQDTGVYPDHLFKKLVYYYYWSALRDSIKLLIASTQKQKYSMLHKVVKYESD